MSDLIIPEFKFAIRDDLENCEIDFTPKRGEPFATGYDVRAAFENRKPLVIKPGEYFKIPLGFRALPQDGWWFQLHPRSSSFVKKYMHNLIGIIDEHYSHEVIFAGQYLPEMHQFAPLQNNTSRTFRGGGDDLQINFGDAIGQIIPVKRVDAVITKISNKDYDDLCSKRMTVRNGGFGSTG